MTLLEHIASAAAQFETATLAFGQGTLTAYDEAAWLLLWAALALTGGAPLARADQKAATPAARRGSALPTLDEARAQAHELARAFGGILGAFGPQMLACDDSAAGGQRTEQRDDQLVDHIDERYTGNCGLTH